MHDFLSVRRSQPSRSPIIVRNDVGCRQIAGDQVAAHNPRFIVSPPVNSATDQHGIKAARTVEFGGLIQSRSQAWRGIAVFVDCASEHNTDVGMFTRVVQPINENDTAGDQHQSKRNRASHGQNLFVSRPHPGCIGNRSRISRDFPQPLTTSEKPPLFVLAAPGKVSAS